jgi:outer membrane receptor protein involved in Fe transport
VRHDRYSDFGATTNPRLALVWDAAYNLTGKLLYGQAFRAPSFTEQHGINNPVIGGNPDVKPETIRTLEVALAWSASETVQVNLSLFRYAMRDIIRGAPNPAPPPANVVQNRGGQDGRGGELEVVWDATRNLRISGNYAYQRSLDQATRQDAGYAPHHHVYLHADWALARGWRLGSQVNHVAGRKRAPGDARAPVPDYTTVDLALRATPGKSPWDFVLSVRNAFNADVREPSLINGGIPNDLPQAPRALYAQATYRF